MTLPAAAHQIEGAMDLAAQQGFGKHAIGIETRVLPQNRAGDREQRMYRVLMHAPGETKTIARLCRHTNCGRVELSAGIGDVSNVRSQARVEFLLGANDFFLNSLAAL